MVKAKTSLKPKESTKNMHQKTKALIDPRLIPYSPTEELLDESFIGKAILE